MNASILYNEKLSPGYYRMGIRWPASSVVPGQFVMLRVCEGLDPLLRRPFGVYDVLGQGRPGPGGGFSADGIDLVYRVVGRGTAIMSEKSAGEPVDVLGPLGVGFPPPDDPARAVLVGGGMGVVPLHLFARTLPGAALLFGTRSAREAAVADAFSRDLKLGRLEIVTEDGSSGRKGLVTDLLREVLSPDSVVYACGPPAMLKAVAGAAAEGRVKCFVSLERTMACGIGVCLGCAVKTSGRRRELKAYSMVCSDGPVFDGRDIDWELF
ncbi:MAG: dihydroorotate dehydrogenase electron transfer subunit [Thermodesulfobacteriota bacterium]